MSASSAIRGFGFALVMMSGVASGATAVMTGVVDMESAPNATGFHLHDSWTWSMDLRTAGLDTFSIDEVSGNFQPGVLVDLSVNCDPDPSTPCVTQVLFEGPATVDTDAILLDVNHGHLTRLFIVGGSTQMDWDASILDNRWSLGPIAGGYGPGGVAGPITFAQLVPEPGTLESAVLALVIGVALRRVGNRQRITLQRQGLRE